MASPKSWRKHISHLNFWGVHSDSISFWCTQRFYNSRRRVHSDSISIIILIESLCTKENRKKSKKGVHSDSGSKFYYVHSDFFINYLETWFFSAITLELAFISILSHFNLVLNILFHEIEDLRFSLCNTNRIAVYTP